MGCGPRGERHAEGLRGRPDRFELVAVCDLDPARAKALAARLGVPRTYADADLMLGAERPDVLCFATLPQVRLALVELGLAHGVRAIAFEKPIALTLAEARRIVERCAGAGVKAVVCHQLKFGSHWRRARALVAEGELGEVRLLHASGRPSMLRVGTHLVDHMLWLNDGHRALRVIGGVHGGNAYREDHPCPDHVAGVIEFANGVRGLLECGTLAPRLLDRDDVWADAGLTVYATQGWARVTVADGWQALTRGSRGRILSGPADPAPPECAFYEALADWIQSPPSGHPSSVEVACHGFEILIGLALSSLERRAVDLPIAPLPPEPVLPRLERALAAG